MYEVGTKVTWAEIRQNAATKRYLLPNETGIIDKLRAWMTEYDTLFLARYGDAEITGPATSNLSEKPEFDGLNFISEESYEAKLFGAEVTSGRVRVCARMIEAITSVIPEVSSSPMEAGYTQELTPEQLAIEQIKAKLSGVVTSSTAVTDRPKMAVVPDAYDIKGKEEKAEMAQEELRAQLVNRGVLSTPRTEVYPLNQPVAGANSRPEGQVTSSSPSTPVPLPMDVVVKHVIEIHGMMSKVLAAREIGKNTISGKDLGQWFMTTSATHGMDATWEMLASKLNNLVEV
jgi:hypothetical protein